MLLHNQNKIGEAHPKMRDELLKAWAECEAAMPQGVILYIDQVYRTFDESNKLYAQGRTTPGSIVTNAPAGESYHNYALALDFHMITNGKDDWQVGPNWMKVVEIMRSHGFTWGGDFESIKDQPHFEKTYGHNWRELLSLHNQGKFIPGTTYVAI